jgi:hypothetical protein
LMIHRRTSATERSLPANCVLVSITSCRLAGSRHVADKELICARKRLRPTGACCG